MRTTRTVALVAAFAMLVAACGDTAGDDSTTTTDAGSTVTDPTSTTSAGTGDPTSGIAASDLARRIADVPAGDLEIAAAGNREFAADLYALLARGDGNIVFSPTSIRLALAMTYAGAQGNTAEEMAAALHFDTLTPERLHAAMNALDTALESRNREEEPGPEGEERKVFVEIANSLWGQEELAFVDAFLDTLALEYGAAMNLVDFTTAAEEARVRINDWVSERTNGLIPELIAPGLINELTRLVLVNAVYLDATWRTPFDPDLTVEAPFVLLDGGTVDVETMHATMALPYATGDGWQAVEIPYVGDELAMLVIVPDSGRFAEVEALLGDGLLDDARSGLASAEVSLGLPSFEVRNQTMLSTLLRELGMVDAFDGTVADFSGMTLDERLVIDEVIHEAFIAVDEQGTEAAAATAVVMRATSAVVSSIELEIDRPFLFALQDRATGAVLFLGRVVDPSA
jgi:serpin B